MLLFFQSQLLSYSVFDWLVFVALAFCAARFFGLPGMFTSHVAIAIIVCVLDWRWIRAAMRVPGWSGEPDMDFVFMVGVVLRILLINTLLLTVGIPALLAGRRHRTAALSTEHLPTTH